MILKVGAGTCTEVREKGNTRVFIGVHTSMLRASPVSAQVYGWTGGREGTIGEVRLGHIV